MSEFMNTGMCVGGRALWENGRWGRGGEWGEEEASELKNVGILLRVKLLFLALSTGNSLELMTSSSQASVFGSPEMAGWRLCFGRVMAPQMCAFGATGYHESWCVNGWHGKKKNHIIKTNGKIECGPHSIRPNDCSAMR